MQNKFISVIKKYTDFKKIFANGKKLYYCGIVVYFLRNSNFNSLDSFFHQNTIRTTFQTTNKSIGNFKYNSHNSNPPKYSDNNIIFRYAISISKKYGKAVKRNKLRRQIKEILHKSCVLPAGVDVIIHITKNFTQKKFNQIENSIKEILQKITIC